jgi:hypothetical protein
MVVNIDCPICEKGKLQVNIKNGYKVVCEGKMSELPCKIYCKNCRRFIKYKVVKESESN